MIGLDCPRTLVLPAPIVPVIMSNDSIAPMIIEAGTTDWRNISIHSKCQEQGFCV
jgi:hypothetical protein